MIINSLVVLALMAFAVGVEAIGEKYEPISATAYFSSGRVELVKVKNRGHYFCYWNCMVDHRHSVHDIKWNCDGICDHFVVKLVDRTQKGVLTNIKQIVASNDF